MVTIYEPIKRNLHNHPNIHDSYTGRVSGLYSQRMAQAEILQTVAHP